MQIKVLDQEITVKLVSNLGKTKEGLKIHGKYDPDTKTITILKKQDSKNLMDTVIHEMLHAADYYKDEEWVYAVATNIADALWQMGYRKIED